MKPSILRKEARAFKQVSRGETNTHRKMFRKIRLVFAGLQDKPKKAG